MVVCVICIHKHHFEVAVVLVSNGISGLVDNLTIVQLLLPHYTLNSLCGLI